MQTKKQNLETIQILGAYGTKAKGYGTSSFFLNSTNVIDAGNLLNSLESASAEIENIWITHSHLDHIIDIAYILDNYFSLRKKPLTLLALPSTIDAIKKHFLNDTIWPDFSKIKLFSSDEMAVVYKTIELDKIYKLADNEYIKAFETDHTVPSCGYVYSKNNRSVMITADTHSLDNVIKELEMDSSITSLVVECSFPNNMKELAMKSKHLTAELLFEKLKMMKREDIRLYINHIKPSYMKKIAEEIEENRAKMMPVVLKDGDFINF